MVAQGKDTLDGECDRLLQREIQRLDAAVVAVGERLLPPSQTVLEAFPSAAGSDGPLHLTLFCPSTGHDYTGVDLINLVHLLVCCAWLTQQFLHRSRLPSCCWPAAVLRQPMRFA